MLERLQKIIARAGIASRRRAEDLIVSGQVEVNGQVITTLGVKADPDLDSIRVAGRRLRLPDRRLLVALHKPDACLSTLADPAGRPTLRDFLRGVPGRVFPVGGLEYHATGLVLLAGDGDLAERLSRALARGLPRTYQVKVKNPLSPPELARLAPRVGHLRVCRRGRNPWYEVRLSRDGLDRLRGNLREMGHLVEKVKRIAVGRVALGDLESGRWRLLEEPEIRALEADLNRYAAEIPPRLGPAREERPVPAARPYRPASARARLRRGRKKPAR